MTATQDRLAGLATAGLEREAKLSAPDGFELPDLDGVLDAVAAEPAQHQRLDAVYYDTPDLALARSGLTLRHRTGESGPRWTLKLPAGRSSGSLARRELGFRGPARTVPAAARDLLRAHLMGRRLTAVARLRTERTMVALRDGSGVVAEVVDDVVSVERTGEAASTFHEVEVELTAPDAPTADRLLQSTVERLVAAGCQATKPTPKLVQALGAAATAPPDIVLPELDESPTVGQLVRHALASSVARLVRHDPGVRLGEDPEDVHQFRVATRRLRSDLQTFSVVLEPEWVRSLRSELRWLGGEVGAVRDGDVLTDRLRAQSSTLPAADTEGARLLLDRLAAQREGARAEMLAALRSARYDKLLIALVEGARAPVFAAEAASEAPAGQLVVQVVHRQWRRLRRGVAALPDPPSDAELHQVRILAKRCRYAAEAAIPAVGKPAVRFATAIAGVQGVLGDHHDATVAEQWLRAAAAEISEPAAVLAAGQLIALERADNLRLRAAWPPAWRAASAKKLRGWLSSAR